MARFFPPEFPERDFRRGEQAVWDDLNAQLPGDAAVFYSVRLPDGTREREIDYVVAWPGEGIAVLEVKGGTISRDDDGRWWGWNLNKNAPLRINPMEQASEVRHQLSAWLHSRHAQAAYARIQHLVVLPHTDTQGYDAHDFRSEQVVDKPDRSRLAARILTAIQQGDGREPLSREAFDELTHLLMPAFKPDEEVGDAAEAEDAADRMSRDLAERVAEWRYFPRLKVIGGAGTGKTWLAMAQAQRLAKENKRVALVCYSRGLAAFLERQTRTWSKKPAYVGRFHGLGAFWGGPPLDDSRTDAHYWEDELPRGLGEIASGIGAKDKLDALVVDEGQDFGAHWWPAVEHGLRGGDGSGLYVFMDDDQRVFPREGVVPITTPPIVLGRNLRNTQRIAGVFSSLATEQVTAKGMKGSRVRFVACSTHDALSRADDAVADLVEKWDPGQIALLTTKNRHPVHVETIERRGWDAYWDDFFAGDDVVYGTVGGFKGLERTVVVLAVNGFSDEARRQQMLYVGLSRARAQLVVVGDLEVIAAAGGEGVRKRLVDAEQWQPPSDDD
ncbi:MAG: NERD domain-containing protein [Actinomycetota bacterium]|nr:NERD domain-containing protein [Actinomycetota bacterium]